MKRYAVDHNKYQWMNDIELLDSGINDRMENTRNLEKRVKLYNLGKEMRNLKTRPTNKILGLLRRYFL